MGKNRDLGGQIALWQGNSAPCQRGVCSSHCPLAHTHTHTHAHTHMQCTHMLTPALKPISFAQGMGTPLISLLPLSLSLSLSLFLHIIPVLLLTLSPSLALPSSSPLSPSRPDPVLSCPVLSLLCHFLWYPFLPLAVLLSSTCAPVSSPRSFFISCLHLCPIYPEHGLCFFPIICFWFPRIRKALCALSLRRGYTQTHEHTCARTHMRTHFYCIIL